MSVIVAVRDDQDIVLASDGRVLGEDARVMADDALKTLALNADLCLGLAGPSDAMRQVLACLGLRCRASHPIDLLRSCQEVSCPVDIGYADARNEVSGLLRFMLRRARSSRAARIPAVVLAGRLRNDPALCGWQDPTWTMDQAPPFGYSQAVVGSLPREGSTALAMFRGLVRGEETTVEAEHRLTRAVRFCAHHFGVAGPVNETVYLRRMSGGFALSQAE
jgi:hypothetical protein